MRTILLLVFFAHSLFAQQEIPPFGQISPNELEMKQYDKDPDAPAVILFDRGISKFVEMDGFYDLLFTRRLRIKIFDKSAFDFANIEIATYDGKGNKKKEKIEKINASSFDFSDGKWNRHDLEKDQIFVEQINNNWSNTKFVTPGVKEGSIIDIEYEVLSPYHFNLTDWYFQAEIPTMYSEYQAHMIPYYDYIFIAQGMKKFDYQHSEPSSGSRTWASSEPFKDNINIYAMHHVPAFKDEGFTSAYHDNIMKIDFQLAKFYSPYGAVKEVISTWPKLNEGLLNNEWFGKYMKSASGIAKSIPEFKSMREEPDEIKRAKSIIEYVKQTFIWNGYHSKRASQTAKQFYKSKIGTSGDINLFMIAMLNEAGIQTQAVILSTRNNGKMHENYPFDQFSNYVVALVEGQHSFLADGSISKLPFDKIPPKCFNERALIVNKSKEAEWLDFYELPPSNIKFSTKVSIDPISAISKNKITLQATEFEAYKMRSEWLDKEEKIKEHYESIIGDISSIKTVNYEKVNKPYIVALSSEQEIAVLDGTIFVNPFANLAISENPFTQEARNYPVDLNFPFSKSFDIFLEIPDGYNIEKIPEEVVINNDIISMKSTYSPTEKQLRIQAEYTFKKTIYSAREYQALKTEIDTIVKHFNQEIVLKQK